MDQGTNFMSGVLKGVCATLKIRQLRMVVYHPKIDGLVECFNHKLEGMIRACIQGDPQK